MCIAPTARGRAKRCANPILAHGYRPEDPDFVGVFVIFRFRAPAPIWRVQRSAQGLLQHLEFKKPYPHVNHYAFLKKLRAKGLVEMLRNRSRYHAAPSLVRFITALLLVRDHVTKPIVAMSSSPPTQPLPDNHGHLDAHYRGIEA